MTKGITSDEKIRNENEFIKGGRDNFTLVQDADGDTILHLYIYFKDDDEIIKLIDAISKYSVKSLNLQNSDGQTALHIATILKKLDVVKSLVQRGIDQTITEYTGKTAFHIACAMDNLELIKILSENNFHRSLMRNTDFSGETILHSALKSKVRNEVLSYLVTNLHADVNMKDSRSGRNIFHILAEEGDIDLFKLLVKMTEDIDLRAQTFSGHTIFQLAIGWRNMRVVEYLYQIGAHDAVDDYEDEDYYSESDLDSDSDSSIITDYCEKNRTEKEKHMLKQDLSDFINMSFSK